MKTSIPLIEKIQKLGIFLLLVILTFALISCVNTPARDYWPTQNWQTASPESLGFDSEKLAAAINTMKSDGTAIHSLTIIRYGKILLDFYFYPYDGTTLHDVASVTKSVTTTLIGIAADQGLLDMDAPMVSFFPDRVIAYLNDWKKAITVRDLASMSSGLDCYRTTEVEPTLQEMKASEDWVQFALDLEAIHEPGTVWNYCSPGMHILSAILTQATGMSALEFAQQNLFTPLGINEVIWPADAAGINEGWGDLALFPRDMAKIGYLWANHGLWDGQQIVSRQWIEKAIKPQITTDNDDMYGYGFWINQGGIHSFRAAGRNGQEIQVVPDFDVVIVKTGGGFDPAYIDQLIQASVGDVEHRGPALPENPEGQVILREAIASVFQAPAPSNLSLLPEIVNQISGKKFIGEEDTPLEYLVLTFQEPDVTQLELKLTTEGEARVDLVGLDGLYRDSLSGRIVKARGDWADEQTFVIEYNEGPGLDLLTLKLHFEGNQVQLEFAGRTWIGVNEE